MEIVCYFVYKDIGKHILYFNNNKMGEETENH